MKKLMMILAGAALLATSAPAFAGQRPSDRRRRTSGRVAGVYQNPLRRRRSLLLEGGRGAFDKDYKVVFVNGAKVEFAKNGEWKDVECKYGEVPAAIVPQQIRDYVTKNYPKNKIVAIDRDRRDYEVELDNGLDLKFDLKFRLIDIDN